MATIANRLPAPRLRERLARTLRGFFLPGDVTTLLIAVVPVPCTHLTLPTTSPVLFPAVAVALKNQASQLTTTQHC